jgi:hypothetical protein
MITNKKSKPTRWAIIGVLFVVVSLLFIAPMARVAVAGQGETSSGFQVSASGNQIISKIQSSGTEKEYQATMDTSQGVKVHVEFEAETANMETELSFQVTYVKLIEFTDPSGTLTSSSTTLGSIDLTKLTYTPVSFSQGTYNGLQGYRFVTNGTQNSGGGNFMFKVVAYAFPNSANINTTTLSPSSLKIVTYIMNYPYIQSNSLLALQVTTQSDRSIDTSSANSQEEVMSSDSSLGEQAVFMWNGPLTVNGSPSSTNTVKFSVTSQGDESKTLNIVYPHGTTIVQDPMLGLSLSPVPFYLQTAFLLGAGAAAVVVAVLSVITVAKRTRR